MLELVRTMARGLLQSPRILQEIFAGHCEVAQRLAERFGFSGEVVVALGQLYERWDGKGLPHGLQGEAIATAVLVVTLAQDMILFHRLGGLEAATSFRFHSQQRQIVIRGYGPLLSPISLRKEERCHGALWYAYKRRHGHLHKRYVGRSAGLTLAKLDDVAPGPSSRTGRPLPECVACRLR